MGELSNTTINGVSYDFKDAGAARQSHSHTKSQITDFPTLGTASAKDVPSSGNASTSQVVMGNDSRLSDARTPTSHTHTKSQITDFPTSMPASDVYSWAKQSSKPSYTASEVGAIATSAKGAANGVASLDSTGKVPSSQLPSYVDDVLEYSAKSSFPSTGETGKIYVDTTTNKTYRWSGSAYVEISASLALGETSSTAYRGDRGKTAYNHSQVTSGNPHNVTKSDVGLGNVGNFKAVSTVASQGLSDTEKSNARSNIGAGTSSFSGSYNDLSNKPTIPTKTSQLTNDSGYTTNTGTVTGVKVGSTSYSQSSGIVSLPAYPTTLPASDVYSWAKQSSKPSYTASEVGLGNVGNFKAVSTVASQGLSSTEKSNARANIGAGTYSKPSGGIPKTDLASAVQTLLDGIPSPPSGFTKLGTLPGTEIANETGGFVNYGPIVFVNSTFTVPSGKSRFRLFYVYDIETYPSEYPLPLMPTASSESTDATLLRLPVYDDLGSVISGCSLYLYCIYSKTGNKRYRYLYRAELQFDTATTSNTTVTLHFSYLGKSPQI